MQKKRILLWAPLGSGEHYWGPGISAYRLYGLGLPNSIEVDLAHGFSNQKDPKSIFSNIYYISNLNRFGILGKIIFFIKSWFFIANNYKRYDAVHCLGAFEYSFRPALWFQQRGINAFCKITDEKGGLQGHSILSDFLGISKARKKRLNDISGYIAISTEIVKILQQSGVVDSKIFKIPNGVNVKEFYPVSDINQKEKLREKYSIDSTKIVGLFVGGISKRKQPFELVKILKRLVDNGANNFILILVGPDRSGIDKELDLIKEYIQLNGLEKYCLHFDHTNQPLDFYQLSDFFLLPSLSEGMSNAALEALSCGLPALVTPVSGMKDLVENGYNGFVSPIDNFESYILKWISNPLELLSYSKNARTKIEKEFDSKIILDNHINLFINN